MKNFTRHFLSMTTAALIGGSAVLNCGLPAALAAEAKDGKLIPVIISLSGDAVLAGEAAAEMGTDYLDTAEADAKAASLRQISSQAEEYLRSLYPELEISYRYDVLMNGFSCSLPAGLLDEAGSCRWVKDITKVETVTILGDASGGAVVKKGDPSYCTFLKSDDTIRISNSAIQLSHTGMGGKGISSDRDFLFENSMLMATFACDGSGYLNAEGEEDYYTSKILDSDGNMLIRSGHVDILQKGLGGKGITCDGNLELGEMLAEDSLLQMTIETQGSAIINDTILDKRFGCPKAYKGKSHVYVYSGRINAVTHGMGGEGIECNGYMKIEGGEITCETFDDGINVQKNLTINGGKTYVFSSDNDGIDLNGNLTINGGMVVALNAHFRDEDFDCDEYRNFTINGGTILGIARDFSRPTEVNQPYAQHTPALWRPDYSGKDSVNVHDFHKGECITIADHDSNPYVTVRMPADVPCAFITASAPWMKDGEDVYVFQSESVPENSTLTLSGKTFLGGSTMQGAPLITIPITTKILGATTN